MPTTNTILQLRGITRDFKLGSQIVHVLKGIDLDIGKNEYVALMGPSGSGKSTLLGLLAGLDTATSGEIFLNGNSLHDLDEEKRAKTERERLINTQETIKTDTDREKNIINSFDI